jgi:Tol biopolymer transport system component
MTRFALRRVAPIAFCLLGVVAPTAQGQYFGRNKVQYETFPWKIIRSDHFDNFFYPPESVFVNNAAREAERWYARHSEIFRHAFDRKSLIFYADHPDFEQTNVVSETLEEGIGGVTESMRTRVIMPFTGINADDDHVLGHELVHVFQYNIAEGAPGGGLARLNGLPGWLIEGMAEYLSLGRESPLTAMWMRDAVLRNKFPTIKQVTTDPRYFPYRYGQALWAYIGGRWGDRAVVDVYRASLRLGWDQALVRVLGMNADSLSKEWGSANRALYIPMAQGRTKPDSVGHQIVGLEHRAGDQNVSPVLSPNGKMLAFVSSRNLFTTDVFIADAETGHIIKKLAGPSSDPHFDNISWINSAGDWSPDASKFAFIVYADGDNEIAIFDTRNSKEEGRYKVGDIGAITHLAWSPDGKSLAFSGLKGGQSDLYVMDLATKQIAQLTNDQYSDVQPTWSPDGKMIAFSSDRGPETDFKTLHFSPLKLAVIDVASRQVTVLPGFSRGKHINPQYSPDGRDIFFVSDQDGIPDLYRLSLGSGQLSRITKVTTGVSGITEVSPAISVARGTGRVAFTMFQEQGFRIHSLEATQVAGEAVPAIESTVPSLAILPPGDEAGREIVTAYRNDPSTGLPSGADFRVVPYHSQFSLDALGQPSVGVTTGGYFGTGLVGGVSAYFGDQLSDQQIVTAVSANGTVKDIGGAAYYFNFKKRWNYGYGIEHIPYLTGGVFLSDSGLPSACQGQNCYFINQVLQRVYVSQASFITQYPFSSTRRFELNATATRLGYDLEDERFLVFNNAIVNQERVSLPGFKPLYYVSPAVALAGDNSFAAYTSPVAGGRWRVEYSPTIGNISFQTLLVDWRKYLFAKPFTFALRGLSYGRYGKDAENGDRLSSLYLGEETLIRGYGYGSFQERECTQANSNQQSSCPVFDRLFGSRIAVANAEFRIPLLGSSEFGLLNFPFLPTEIAPFLDAGVSYTSDQPISWRLTRTATEVPQGCVSKIGANGYSYYPCAERIPVFSTGIAARINFLGYLILEAYFAHPFQRPDRDWLWGFQLAPGW